MPSQQQQPENHVHPVSGRVVYGVLLGKGDIVGETDLYASTSGDWERSPCPDCELIDDNPDVIWVRPMPKQALKAQTPGS